MVRLGLVAAQFNKDRPITHEMTERARDAAADTGAKIVETIEVPGSYDTPLAADRLARRDDIDAVVVIGAIVTGDTDHDKVIADAAVQGLTDVSLDRDTPVTLGIIGPGMSQDEAVARIDYGATAVESAIDLATEFETEEIPTMTDYTFADRVERVSPSATLAISNKATELEADGVDVVDLSVGEPDFDTPKNIKDAAQDALAAGHTGYTPSSGIPELREAIAEKLAEDGLDQYGPENVMVTPGGKQALFELFQTLVQEEDEVVLLDPAWVSYEAMAKIAGADLKRVDTAKYDFRLHGALDDLTETVSDETDLLVVNSPGNPHGAVYSDAALEGVRDLAVEHDFLVISDEIYKEVTYEDVEMTSLGTLDGMEDRTLTLNGFSKAYAMTGWRLGYFAAPEDIVEQAGKVHGHSVSCAVNFVQHAGIEALENTDEAVMEMVDAFEERRDMVLDEFGSRGVDVAKPEGAFYLMLPVADDDQAWCDEAISQAHVAAVPGSAFGTPGYARLSYANSKDRLREAIDRLEANDLL